MYRIAFAKHIAGDLHDQEIYRMNVNSLEKSDSCSSANEDQSPKGASTHSISPEEKKEIMSASARNTISLSSTDSEFSEDNEFTRRMHNEISKISPEARIILRQTFKPMEIRPIRCGLNIMLA